MGQPQSKKVSSSGDDPSSPSTTRRAGDDLDSYPSLSRTDTKESSRSLRGSIRSKIPGSGRTESPRESSATLPSINVETSETANRSEISLAPTTSSAKSGSSKHRRSLSGSSVRPPPPPPPPPPELSESKVAQTASPPPSPTPRHGPGSGAGHGRRSIEEAKQSGEVGNVSDGPPSGALHQPHRDQAMESILIRRPHAVNPVASDVHPQRADEGGSSSSPSMTIGPPHATALDDMISRLLDAGYAGKVTKAVCLKNAEITAVCAAARELFLAQPALIELSPPVKIVGDVHGQYTDLIRMFEMCGFPPSANYLFLGDYVDRGKQSLETILLLLCYKLKFPENFFLLRGNHECANVTRVYGFYDECKRRCNIKVWKTFVDTFNCLPIAAIVADKIFCVHGGLSPSLNHMDDIRQIARPTDVPDYGLLNDLLWSDPAEMEAEWESNERGVSYCFGKKVIMDFLQRHDFDLVCRAHMVVEDGYEFFNDRILVTVFSAPNVRAPPPLHSLSTLVRRPFPLLRRQLVGPRSLTAPSLSLSLNAVLWRIRQLGGGHVRVGRASL